MTGWEIHPSQADRNHIEATISALAPLCEVAVECQAEAVSATDSLKNVLAALPPIKERAKKTA
jgi:hypothetical protein